MVRVSPQCCVALRLLILISSISWKSSGCLAVEPLESAAMAAAAALQVLRTAKAKPAAGPDDAGFGTASVRDAISRVVDLLDPVDRAQLRARLSALADDPRARADARARGELAVLAAATEDLVVQVSASAARGAGSVAAASPANSPQECPAPGGVEGPRLVDTAAAVQELISVALGRPEERSRAVRETLVTDAVGRLEELDLIMDRFSAAGQRSLTAVGRGPLGLLPRDALPCSNVLATLLPHSLCSSARVFDSESCSLIPNSHCRPPLFPLLTPATPLSSCSLSF